MATKLKRGHLTEMKLLNGVLAGMVLLGSSVALEAASIGPNNCPNNSCFGSIYSLTDLGVIGSTATTQTRRWDFTINTAGFTGLATDYIQQVAIKVTSSVLSFSLFAAPGGPGNWSLFANSTVSNNGCQINGGSGFSCAGTTAVIAQGNAQVGGTLTWVFDIQANNNTWLASAPIKANYNPANGLITSETITGLFNPPPPPNQVPEPMTVGLLVGGIGVWLFTQRRRFAA